MVWKGDFVKYLIYSDLSFVKCLVNIFKFVVGREVNFVENLDEGEKSVI